MSNKVKDAAFLQESETGASDANLCGEEAGQEEVNIVCSSLDLDLDLDLDQ